MPNISHKSAYGILTLLISFSVIPGVFLLYTSALRHPGISVVTTGYIMPNACSHSIGISFLWPRPSACPSSTYPLRRKPAFLPMVIKLMCLLLGQGYPIFGLNRSEISKVYLVVFGIFYSWSEQIEDIYSISLC